jgi:hypothetical protein
MYQASIATLTASVRDLKQSLHHANMDLGKQKRRDQDLVVSTESNVQKLKKSLVVSQSELEDKTALCIVQATSILDLKNKVQGLEEANQANRVDLNKSRQRCDAQTLAIISFAKIKQELEKSLRDTSDDLSAKAQLYSSQQPYIDRLKTMEMELQRSLQSSRRETQAEKNRCTLQESSIAGMKRELQELKVELESTLGKLVHAEMLCNMNTRDDEVSNSGMDVQQFEVDFDIDNAETNQPAGMMDGLTSENSPAKANTARKRQNDNDLELDSGRKAKRHQGTPTTDAIASTFDDNYRRQAESMPQKLASLEQIRNSPWARDKSEDARHFVDSLTPALCVSVLSRLVKLSKSFSVRQVVLQINLKQLDSMCGDPKGSSTTHPIVENGFAISERHVRRFTKLWFDKARLEKLLDFQLDRAKLGPESDGETLGFKPSGLFTLVLRRDSPNTARTLRELFDAETIATMQVTKMEPYRNAQAPHHSGLPKHAPDGHAQDIKAKWNLGDQNDDSSTCHTHRTLSKQDDRLHGQTQTGKAPIALHRSGNNGDSGRAKANGQPSTASKHAHNNFMDTEHPRKAAATSKAKCTTRSKAEPKSSQGAAGANGRSRRKRRPSRRATEAASAERG